MSWLKLYRNGCRLLEASCKQENTKRIEDQADVTILNQYQFVGVQKRQTAFNIFCLNQTFCNLPISCVNIGINVQIPLVFTSLAVVVVVYMPLFGHCYSSSVWILTTNQQQQPYWFTDWFIDSFTTSFTHSLLHPFIDLPTHPCTYQSAPPFTDSDMDGVQREELGRSAGRNCQFYAGYGRLPAIFNIWFRWPQHQAGISGVSKPIPATGIVTTAHAWTEIPGD